MGENALLKMAPVLERFAARQPAYRPTEEPLAFLRGIGEDPQDPAGAVARLRAADPRLAIMFEPMLGVTFTPTRISASEKINVIPSRAELKVDCRVPPGLGEEEVREGLAEVLESNLPSDPSIDSEPPWQIEFTERVVGNRSPVGLAADGRDRRLDRRAGSRRGGRAGGAARASPTRATSAWRSPSASPTASSPSATSRCCRPRR